MALRVLAVGVFALGAGLSAVAAGAVVHTLRDDARGVTAAPARQECPAAEAQTLPAVIVAEPPPDIVASPITMPSTGTAGLLGAHRGAATIQEPCPTASPVPATTVEAPSPTAAQPTLTPIATPTLTGGETIGDIDAPEIGVPGVGY